MPVVMAEAFLSIVSKADMALSCTSGEPFDLTHTASSSIAAAIACWLCSRSVSASAVSMWASVLSGISSSLSVEEMGFKALAPDMTEEGKPRIAYVFSKIFY